METNVFKLSEVKFLMIIKNQRALFYLIELVEKKNHFGFHIKMIMHFHIDNESLCRPKGNTLCELCT